MPNKRSDDYQSVNRRRFLGASVSTAAIPFVGKSLDEAVAEPLAPASSDGPLSVALSRSTGPLTGCGSTCERPCSTPYGNMWG
jgi:hypothetical protein